jgi:IS30 family transposase
MSYTQLTQEERYQIYALKKAGHVQAEIAGIVGRDPGTISRELRRYRGLKGCRPQQAHNMWVGEVRAVIVLFLVNSEI